MDCLKNLTACMGCTKKHAKCSWKDVVDEELRDNPIMARPGGAVGKEDGKEEGGFENLPIISGAKVGKEYVRDEGKMQQGVRDEELLGEDSEEEEQTHEHAPLYHEGQEPILATNANDTNFETNNSFPTIPAPPHELSNPLTTSPTEPHAQQPQYPIAHDPMQVPNTQDPGSPQLSSHAVGQSLDLTPQPSPNPQIVQKSAKLESTNQDRARAEHIAEQLVRANADWEEAAREREEAADATAGVEE